MRAGTHSRAGVLIRRPPGAEEEQNITDDEGAHSTDVQSPRSRMSRRRRRDASLQRSLTEGREAHQKALAMVATLKEKKSG